MLKHKYDVILEGAPDGFHNRQEASFLNPVGIGHKIMCEPMSDELLLVKDIVHFPTSSVLYVSPTLSGDLPD